jgi:predicted MFS family arabinose efflux permease
MMMPWGSAFAVNNLHVSYEQLPVLFMVGGIVSLIIMPLVGKLSDKIDKAKLFTIAATWMIMTVVVYTNLSPVPFTIVVIMNILMMIGILSRIVPAMALVLHCRICRIVVPYEYQFIIQQIAGGVAAGVGE